MPTIISSYGGSESNAYCNLVEANSIVLSSSLDYQRWTDASTVTREIALIQATRHIEGVTWYGSKFFYNQSLAAPRSTRGSGWLGGNEVYGWNYPEDKDSFPWQYYGANLAATSVNTFNIEYQLQREAFKRANAYQAVHLLRMQKGRNRHRERQSQGVTSYSEGIGKLSESYSYGQTALSLCPEAYDELRPYLGAPMVTRG